MATPDELDELFVGRRLRRETVARIRDMGLQVRDLLDLSPVLIKELCQAVEASAGEAFMIQASIGVAKHSALTGIRSFGSQAEGLNSRLYITERKETMDKLESLVLKERAVIIRAPPQTGKTSLLQLLRARAGSKFSAVFTVSLAGMNGHDFEYMWYQHYPTVSIEALSSSSPTLLLVDEGQSGFHLPTLSLWGRIKSAQQGESSHLHIVLVSSFGSDECDDGEGELPPTPVIFSPNCSVTLRPQEAGSGVCLQFTDTECGELWRNWCRFCEFAPRNQDILNYVAAVGDRQPGLMTHMLDWLVRMKFHDKNRKDCEEFAKRELLSDRFLKSLCQIRSISTFRNLFWKPGYSSLHSKLLASGSVLGCVEKSSLTEEELSAANKLFRRGQLARSSTMSFSFPSSLHRHYYASLCASATLTLEEVQAMGIEIFLTKIIQRMSAQRLAASRSRGSVMYERQYQNEFYRAYCTLVDVAMSPDAGKLYGVNGYVDFYLADLKWAFEIARDGIRLAEHLARFEHKGRYRSLIDTGVVDKYVVVNMESAGAVYEDEPGLVQVVFEEDFAKATVLPCHQTVVLMN